jgi:hypothetical protein
MDAFLKTAAAKLTIDLRAATEAAAEILLVLRGRMDPVEFGRILSALPGSAELLATRLQPPPKGIAGRLQQAGSLLGTRPGGSLDATTLARICGLAYDSIGPFVAFFLEHIGEQAGQDSLDRIRQSAPELEALSRRK